MKTMRVQLGEHEEGAVISVKVVPNSSREGIVGVLGTDLKIKVSKPPEGGAANRAVEGVLAGALGVAAGRVSVVGGHSQARKMVLVRGMTVEGVRAGLERYL